MEATETFIRKTIETMGTLDEKLTYLTEIFCTTEEIRWELSEGNQSMEKGRRNLVRTREEVREEGSNPGLPEPTNGTGE